MKRVSLALTLALAAGFSMQAAQAQTLKTIKDRGSLSCGVSQGLPGFSAPDDKGNTQIWIANADGSSKRQVTTDIGTHGMPTWSSDGQWLFYRTDQGGKGWAIFAIRTSGSDAHKIVDSNVNADDWTYARIAIAP